MKSLFQTLKTPLLVALLVITPALAVRAQDSRIQMSSLDHLATKAKQTVAVTLDERLMRMAAKLFPDHGDEKEVKDLLNGIKGIYVKSFEFEADGQYSPADIEGIRSQLRGPGWSQVMSFNSKTEGNVEVYLLFNADKVGGIAVLSADDRELTVVNIVGPVDVEKLSKLEGQFGVPDLGIESKKEKEKKNDK
ncbi:MAG TPA: DUF4252 domain-containing protein [Pyrinomonadaceae bacterium]|nr:DUF4252 domain-containing protein [Pyrinomonadaceae bacterium]